MGLSLSKWWEMERTEDSMGKGLGANLIIAGFVLWKERCRDNTVRFEIKTLMLKDTIHKLVKTQLSVLIKIEVEK